MLHFADEMSQCTGCGACASICPLGCISLVYDDEGFAYPRADSRCVGCGECHDVCPVLGDSRSPETRVEQFCVAARHLDHAVRERSSSGGAFFAICQAYCDDGDVIFGAKFEGLRVVHDYACSVDEVEPFMRSKYVQSDLRDSYQEAMEFLESERKVLFSGTPCQVAGLKSFLGQEYDNLLCIDLICHGVGSPGVFHKYIKYLETRYGSRVVAFSFRNKRVRMGRFSEYVVRTEFENGTKIEDSSDLYNTAFLQALLLRPSCGECRFAGPSRMGDITIGDLKDRYDVLPEVKGLENLSTIVVNTEKGREVFDSVRQYMSVYPILMEDVIRTNNPFRETSKMSDRREEFFNDLQMGVPIEDALEKHITVYRPRGLLRKIWSIIPDRMKAEVRRRIR